MQTQHSSELFRHEALLDKLDRNVAALVVSVDKIRMALYVLAASAAWNPAKEGLSQAGQIVKVILGV